ncbi:MAG: rhodanese-like domain-containing protein, partial [Candidatus Eisenbacteria bacterium]
YLVFEHAGERDPWAALTGDTLFVGDVGRVDILSSRLPVTELAGMLYDSVHDKLLRLPDGTRVYPAHGAGSLCGRGISGERWSTIGQERRNNAALRPMSREAFVAEVTRDVPETPIYFLHSRDLNRSGPPVRTDADLPPVLTPRAVAAAVAGGALIIDTRPTAAYATAHPTGALHVGLDGQYASWVGTLVKPDRSLVLLTAPDRAEEAVVRLARVGYENVAGTLSFDVDLWRSEGLRSGSLAEEPIEVAIRPERGILDVRRSREWEQGHLAGARHVPLAELPDRVGELDPKTEWVLVCASGYRSGIAASVLERAGFPSLVNAGGGMDLWSRAGRPLTGA